MAERSIPTILGRAVWSTDMSLNEDFPLRISKNWETVYSTASWTIYWASSHLFKTYLKHQTQKGLVLFSPLQLHQRKNKAKNKTKQNKVRNHQSTCDSSAGRDSKHQQSRELLRRDSKTDNEDLLTWAVVSALHIEQMASASSSVFFFTCNNCAAWMRGSRVSLAPLFIKFLSRSHSSSWLTLYLYKSIKNINAWLWINGKNVQFLFPSAASLCVFLTFLCVFPFCYFVFALLSSN